MEIYNATRNGESNFMAFVKSTGHYVITSEAAG